jgi:hypothetical protein
MIKLKPSAYHSLDLTTSFLPSQHQYYILLNDVINSRNLIAIFFLIEDEIIFPFSTSPAVLYNGKRPLCFLVKISFHGSMTLLEKKV